MNVTFLSFPFPSDEKFLNSSLSTKDDIIRAADVICMMQVAGHLLWPRAAWLYNWAILLMTLSFVLSGGILYAETVVRFSYGAWN